MSGTKKRKGKIQPFAVEKYKVEDFVLELYKDNVPATAISKRLEVEKNVKISPLGVNRWLKGQREKDSDMRELQSKEKFDVMTIDYKNEITSILEEVKGVRSTALAEGKLDTYVKLVGKLYQGIELLAKLMGDVKSQGGIDINIIINEINERSFDKNKKMRSAMHTFDDEIIDIEADIIEEGEEK